MTNKKGHIKIFQKLSDKNNVCSFWRFLDKALLLLPNILFFAVVVLSFFIVMFVIYHWGWFNANSGGIQAISTAILAMITAVYVWLVYRSVQELEKQRKKRLYQQIYDNLLSRWIKELKGKTQEFPGSKAWSYIDSKCPLLQVPNHHYHEFFQLYNSFISLSKFHHAIVKLIKNYNRNIEDIHTYIRSLSYEKQNKDDTIKEIEKKIEEKELLKQKDKIQNYLLEIEENWLKEGLIEIS